MEHMQDTKAYDERNKSGPYTRLTQVEMNILILHDKVNVLQEENETKEKCYQNILKTLEIQSKNIDSLCQLLVSNRK